MGPVSTGAGSLLTLASLPVMFNPFPPRVRPHRFNITDVMSEREIFPIDTDIQTLGHSQRRCLSRLWNLWEVEEPQGRKWFTGDLILRFITWAHFLSSLCSLFLEIRTGEAFQPATWFEAPKSCLSFPTNHNVIGYQTLALHL